MMRGRQAQMEMIGLVLVVVVLIMGILLYLSLRSDNDTAARDIGAARSAQQSQASTAFVTALSETTIPACGTEFRQVAIACADGDRYGCRGLDACAELQKAIDGAVRTSNLDLERKYNLSIVGTGVQNYSSCPSAKPRVPLLGYGEVVISLGTTGRSTALVLYTCR